MITIFGTTYFTTGAGLVVLVLAAPLLFWFARWLWLPNVEDKPLRVQRLAVGGTTLGLLALLAVGLFWDVYLIGQRARELCAETGLVVYRKAPAKSFVGSTDIRYWSQRGFQYVEDSIGGKSYRIELDGNDEVRVPIAGFDSRYQLEVLPPTAFTKNGLSNKHFTLQAYVIKERGSGEILSRVSEYTINFGWLDRLVLSTSGFFAHPPVCGRDKAGKVAFGTSRIGIQEIVEETLTRE